MPHLLGYAEGEGFTDNFRQWCEYGEGSEYADRESYTAEEDEVEDDEEAVDGCDNDGDENLLLPALGMSCTLLQLVIKKVYKGPYSLIIAKTQGLVGRIRKSSVAMEKVISKCGKGVISDNLTHCNRT